ncbi:hypothetical protein [Kutzneria buriramensis]|uniref:Cellulose binding domain-containing protein n=1 Tax=Kutzneria buriramensis TaxID=1045776 RepID=A0A3E0I8A2_9PSEU|nr:hypothetical protein [Kutzneria buriramensis]REH54365.1 hypothetical protein BCF44_102597 [Kutzneria buriramensis]
MFGLSRKARFVVPAVALAAVALAPQAAAAPQAVYKLVAQCDVPHQNQPPRHVNLWWNISAGLWHAQITNGSPGDVVKIWWRDDLLGGWLGSTQASIKAGQTSANTPDVAGYNYASAAGYVGHDSCSTGRQHRP